MCWVREGKREGGRGKWKGLPRDGHRGGTYFGTRQVTVCFVQGDPRKRQPPLPTLCDADAALGSSPAGPAALRSRSDWLGPKTEASSVRQDWTEPPINAMEKSLLCPPLGRTKRAQWLVNGPSCCLEQHEIASGRFWTGIQLFPCTRFCCSHNLWMQLETHNRCSSVASALLGSLSAHK